MCRQTKKVIRILLIVSLCLLLCSCYDGDPYKGKRPTDYPYSYWVCEEANMYFVVGGDEELIDAKVTMHDQTVPCKFIWRKTNNRINIFFDINSQTYGSFGSCEFGEDKFTIQIEYKENSGEGPLLEFERRTLEEYLIDHMDQSGNILITEPSLDWLIKQSGDGSVS